MVSGECHFAAVQILLGGHGHNTLNICSGNIIFVNFKIISLLFLLQNAESQDLIVLIALPATWSVGQWTLVKHRLWSQYEDSRRNIAMFYKAVESSEEAGVADDHTCCSGRSEC